MLTEELGLNLEILGNPLKGALVMFGSFLLGGILPILPYFVVKFGFMSSTTAILVAILISIASSFLIGAIKARIAQMNIIKGGIEMAGLLYHSTRWLWYGSRISQSRYRKCTMISYCVHCTSGNLNTAFMLAIMSMEGSSLYVLFQSSISLKILCISMLQ